MGELTIDLEIVKIKIGDEIYPEQLRKIKNPPKQLYLKGNIELLKQNCIAIIGSRSCTKNGENLAKKFASELSGQGLTIVSGMAKGIDAIVHRKTIDENGKTIAVLGSGLNYIFPKENEGLYYDILKSGGLIISEYSPNVEPNSKMFLERNRIVSGISIGILVIEAMDRSGTSVTARLATQQGRKVFVLPHEIEDIHGKGTNKLIRKGATLITSTQEIIEEFEFLSFKEINDNKTKAIRSKIVKKEYQEIYNLIKNGASNINAICKESEKSIKDINNILFMLEIDGFITKKQGEYKCI
ncbi:MAG: DNA-processing protein DprA [Clostridia bacterium]|nr:DNA-processing protein DprA [Clostridia bacterium]MBP8633684.1 DNA-processing protein DprA [Clostridia bacterium]MED9924618.1 DNA-processing protein DprA [Clostridia bacterium]